MYGTVSPALREPRVGVVHLTQPSRAHVEHTLHLLDGVARWRLEPCHDSSLHIRETPSNQAGCLTHRTHVAAEVE